VNCSNGNNTGNSRHYIGGKLTKWLLKLVGRAFPKIWNYYATSWRFSTRAVNRQINNL